MKKNLRLIAVLIFIVTSYFIIQRSQYEQFYPVIYSAEYDGLVIDDINIPDDFYQNLAKVLEHCDEDYRKTSNIIYVKKSLYKDQDLCWNYTSKANDRVWLNSR